MPGYTLIWEFAVKPGCEAQFAEHYGADGTWARLFRQAEGFVETVLLKDAETPSRYVTIDRWRSPDAWQAFKARFASQYASFDAHCEALTLAETCIGRFDE